uniref:Uncharacterized protein n=1 Tax=Zea mays TaxID=4577 RepID=C4J3K2_MAIZE|nr:unknown [Zea mays]
MRLFWRSCSAPSSRSPSSGGDSPQLSLPQEMPSNPRTTLRRLRSVSARRPSTLTPATAPTRPPPKLLLRRKRRRKSSRSPLTVPAPVPVAAQPSRCATRRAAAPTPARQLATCASWGAPRRCTWTRWTGSGRPSRTAGSTTTSRSPTSRSGP